MELSSDATFYASGGNDPLDVAFSDDIRLLTCKGILLDYVDGIGGLKVPRRDWVGNQEVWEEVHGCINSTSPVNSPVGLAAKDKPLRRDEINPDESSKLIDDISCCLVLNRKDRYLSYPTPPKHFYRDFQDFGLAAIERPLDVQLQFLN